MRRLILYTKIFINFLLVIMAILFFILILPRLLGFFIPFVIGWLVAMIANPLVKFLESKVRLLRKHSSAIIIVIILAAIAGTIYLLAAVLIKEITSLIGDLPSIVEQTGIQFTNLSNRIRELAGALPAALQNMINNLIDGISTNISSLSENKELMTIGWLSTFAKNVTETFLMIIITILSAYFFIANRDELLAGLKKMVPDSVNSGWALIYDNFKTAVGGYFKAQFKIMLVLTGIMFIGFEILGVGYSFLFALGIAFLDFLPVFGTGAVLWPWALVDMLTGNYFDAVGLIVIYLICQVLKQVLQPKMVGDSIGISPLATLFFMYTGYKLYGVIGMILGIPVGMVLVNLYRIGMFNSVIKGFKIVIHDINEFRKY